MEGVKFWRVRLLICVAEKNNQEKTTVDSPQFNGLAVGIIETVSLAARIQASEMYPNGNIIARDNLGLNKCTGHAIQ